MIGSMWTHSSPRERLLKPHKGIEHGPRIITPVCTGNLNPHTMVMKPDKDWLWPAGDSSTYRREINIPLRSALAIDLTCQPDSVNTARFSLRSTIARAIYATSMRF